MSYPGVDPTEVFIEDPVETQETSVGEPKAPSPDLIKAAEAAASKVMKDMFSINSDAWAPKMVVKFKVELPSGQVALLKHLDVLDLLDKGLIEEMDSFTKKLFPSSIDASGYPVDEKEQADTGIWSALRTPEKRQRFLDMTGRLMAAASVKPRILHDGVCVVDAVDDHGNVILNKDGSPKQTVQFGYQIKDIEKQVELLGKPVEPLGDQEVYAGYISVVDRLVIFQELNKPLALIEPFREESPVVLQDVARGELNGDQAE